MTLKTFSFCLFCLISSSCFAQERDWQSNVLPSASSIKGNYIYLVSKLDFDDPLRMKMADHFIIKRVVFKQALDTALFLALQKDQKLVGIAKKPSDVKELKEVLPKNGIGAFKAAFKLKSDADIIIYLKDHSNPNDYSFLYPMIETRMALAHVFLDKDVKKGEAYLYFIYSVDKAGHQFPWGWATCVGKAGNYKLPYFKPIAAGVKVKDSSISMRWAVPININMDTIPLPADRVSFDKQGKLYNFFFVPDAIRASLNIAIDGKWERLPGQIFPEFNKKGDTLFFSFMKKCNPNSVVSSYITLEDEIYNQGAQSDTTNGFVVTKKNAPRISYLFVKDSLNAIWLHWNPLPISPFISGIQIKRYGLDQDVDSLPLLPITDTSFMDYGVKAGINYRYEVRALYLPGMAVYQTTPANSFGTLTKFARPSPPYNLTATNEGKHIRLNWKVADDPTINAFFVYRGLTPGNLKLLPGRIKTTTFLDTTIELSGGNQYYYAVNCQNLRQDSSIYSNVVSATPSRSLNIPPPTEMTFYYANGALNVFWKDIRMLDNQVESFIVQKRQKGMDSFAYITTKPLMGITLKDSAIDAGITYQFRVASLSFKGDTSQFSEIFEYTLPKMRVDVINKFSLLNKPNGITVSLPAAFYQNRKSYNIFRRKETEKEFKKIATIPASKFQYDDTTVIQGETYYYAVSIVETDGREGAMGMSVAIKKR